MAKNNSKIKSIETLNKFEDDILNVIKKYQNKGVKEDDLSWRYQQILHKCFDTGR